MKPSVYQETGGSSAGTAELAVAGPLQHGSRRHHALVIMCFLAVFIGYTDRANVSVAAVTMQEQFGWSNTTKGLVLSAFFAGYLLFMPIVGWLATRYGGRRVLGVGALLWSALTLLTPAAAYRSITTLVATRIGMGIAESSMFPAAYEMLGRSIPAEERTRAVVRVISGIPLGTVIGLGISGLIVARWNWPAVFYAFGLLGVAWVALWAAQTYDTPGVGAAETSRQAVPWRSIFASPAAWAVFLGNFCSNCGVTFFVAWLPSYFRDTAGVSITGAGLLSAAPWLSMFVMTNIAAGVSDWFINRGASIRRVRKFTQIAGLLGPAVLLLFARDAHSAMVSVLLMSAAMSLLGLTWSGYAANILDIAPAHAGMVAGISNTLGAVPSVIGIAATGWLIDVTGTYSAAFLAVAMICTAGAIFYAVFADTRLGAQAQGQWRGPPGKGELRS